MGCIAGQLLLLSKHPEFLVGKVYLNQIQQFFVHCSYRKVGSSNPDSDRGLCCLKYLFLSDLVIMRPFYTFLSVLLSFFPLDLKGLR